MRKRGERERERERARESEREIEIERERESVCVCCDFTTTLVPRVPCFILQVVVILLQQHFILPGDLNEVLAESSSRGAA